MIIRTNLRAPTVEQARTPVLTPIRKAAIAGILLGVTLLGYWLVLDHEVRALRLEFAAKTAIEKPLRQNLELARQRAIALAEKLQKRQTILGYLKGRVNWAPVLERIYSAVPENVQLSELRLTHNPNGACVAQVAGRAAGEQPRIEADKFRVILLDTLREFDNSPTASFIALDDSEQVVHRNRKEMAVAVFSIQVKWVNHANAN
ncbi:MAG: hypothetical protein WCP06_01370 [Verrucomicrobiota bacterium]